MRAAMPGSAGPAGGVPCLLSRAPAHSGSIMRAAPSHGAIASWRPVPHTGRSPRRAAPSHGALPSWGPVPHTGRSLTRGDPSRGPILLWGPLPRTGRARPPRACGLGRRGCRRRRGRGRQRLRQPGLPWSGSAGSALPAPGRLRARSAARPLYRGRPLSRAAGPAAPRCAGGACSGARGLAGPSPPLSASPGRRRGPGSRRRGPYRREKVGGKGPCAVLCGVFWWLKMVDRAMNPRFLPAASSVAPKGLFLKRVPSQRVLCEAGRWLLVIHVPHRLEKADCCSGNRSVNSILAAR